MHHFIRSACRYALFCVLTLACWSVGRLAFAQQGAGAIRGQVTDPSGALIPHAQVTLSSGLQPARTVDSTDYGEFRFTSVPAGSYSLTVEASGFEETRRDVMVKAGQELNLSVRLKIEVDRQRISVSAQGLDSSPDRNLGAVVLRGSDLDALPGDPRDLKHQLIVMAGSDINPQFYVDGFTASHLPPKESIQEIRMNQDPYSAEYDTPGVDRIEIITKPGGDKLHGTLEMAGEYSPLNSRNPYVAVQPPYSAFYSQGDISGPLTKTSSWSLSGVQQNMGTQSLIHAITSSTEPVYTRAISSPQVGTEFTPRVDFQAGKVHSLSFRYDVDHDTQQDLLRSQLSLPTQAVDTRHLEQTLRITDTQTYSEKLVNETRFQFIHLSDVSTPRSTAASVLVQGAFNGGGNNLGATRDVQKQFELQDHVSLLRGNHLLQFGGRIRDVLDTNSSTGGYNGVFVFSSIQAYESGEPSQFAITAGTPKASVNVADLGLYIEDQWKLNPNMTLTPGLRYETQSGIHDHADFAPRVSYGWSIGGKNRPKPVVVFRAGVGMFYQRFTPDLVLNAARQNGVLEQQYVVHDPDFYPDLPAPDELGAATLPTVYRIAPRLHAPSLFQASVGLERQFTKALFIHADYTYYRGIDLLLTRNINAPLPGTYDPSDPASGTRPLGTLQNIYEYESEGASRRRQLYMTVRYDTQPAILYGYLTIGKRETNTDSAAEFPSDQYDLGADYGRASNDIRTRAYIGGLLHLPLRLEANPFFIIESSGPFNITVGQDLNGDSQFNDRPAFATDLTRPSVYRTRWGNFDADPMPGQKTIPVNYGTGPSFIMLNMALSRVFYFGPKTSGAAAGQETPRRFAWNVGLQAQNLLNNVNGGPPLGVLGSPIFGQSTNMSVNQFASAQANRLIYLHTTLNF